MTREVESFVALPVSRNIETDDGDYDANEKLLYLPVYNKAIKLTFAGDTNSWTVGATLKAHADWHPDVVYVAFIKCSDTVAGYYQFSAPFAQYIYVDTVASWRTVWQAHSGDWWSTYNWTLASGSITITEIHFVPCLPVITGVGYEALDTNSDEGSSVIGKISYTPISEFSDVGSCKLYNFYSQIQGDRIYGLETPEGFGQTGYWGAVISNDIIKAEIILHKVSALSNLIKIYHMGIEDTTIFARYTIADALTDPDVWNMIIISNSPELIHIRLRSESTNKIVDIKLRRGEQHLEINTDINGNCYFDDANLGWAWNDGKVDAIRDGVFAADLYTANKIEQFRLDHTAPTNHWAFLWKKASLFNKFVYYTCPKSKALGTIESLSGEIFYVGTVFGLTDPIYIGCTLFTEGLRHEAEDGTLAGTAATEADANAYGGSRVKLLTTNDAVTMEITEWEGYYPDGKYAIAVRAWYEGASSGSLTITVTDVTGAASLGAITPTVTTETYYGEEWFVIETGGVHYADREYEVEVKRTDANVGTIYVDAMVIIPTERKGSTYQPVFFPEGADGLATMSLKEVKQNPEHDKRR
jgi:hypothetical protein